MRIQISSGYILASVDNGDNDDDDDDQDGVVVALVLVATCVRIRFSLSGPLLFFLFLSFSSDTHKDSAYIHLCHSVHGPTSASAIHVRSPCRRRARRSFPDTALGRPWTTTPPQPQSNAPMPSQSSVAPRLSPA